MRKKDFKKLEIQNNLILNYSQYIEDRHLTEIKQNCIGYEILQNCWLQNYHIIIGYTNDLRWKCSTVYGKKEYQITGLAIFSIDNYIKRTKPYFLEIYDRPVRDSFYKCVLTSELTRIKDNDFKQLLSQRGLSVKKDKTKEGGSLIFNDIDLHRIIKACHYDIKDKQVHHDNEDKLDNHDSNLYPISDTLHTTIKNRGYGLTLEEKMQINTDLEKELLKLEPSKNRGYWNEYIYWEMLYLKHIEHYGYTELKNHFNNYFKHSTFEKIHTYTNNYFPYFEDFFKATIDLHA